MVRIFTFMKISNLVNKLHVFDVNLMKYPCCRTILSNNKETCVYVSVCVCARACVHVPVCPASSVILIWKN
jgi:hypothetical protein